MYLPFATDGLALITLVITIVAFSTSFSGVNEILPTGTCTSAVLSVRNSTLPAFTSFTALATSKVTVPVFGFGIRPSGPSTLPRRPTDFITSGVAISGVEVGPVFLLDLLDHVFAADEIGARRFGFAAPFRRSR